MKNTNQAKNLEQYHHRKLPDFSTLLSGHSPRDEFCFASKKLQIWYNNTDESWLDERERPHKHVESDECFIVLKGSLKVDVEGELFTIGPEEYCFFPSGVYHRIVEVHPPVETLMIRSPSIRDKIYQADE